MLAGAGAESRYYIRLGSRRSCVAIAWPHWQSDGVVLLEVLVKELYARAPPMLSSAVERPSLKVCHMVCAVQGYCNSKTNAHADIYVYIYTFLGDMLILMY